MNTLIPIISQAFRTSRAPLTAGSLIVLAIWIQLADRISSNWPGRLFGEQLADVLALLQGFGVMTLLLLAVGVAGSTSTHMSKLIVEPGMRWLAVRWQERCAVRKHKRSKRSRLYDVRSEWGRKVIGWTAMEVHANLYRGQEPFETMRKRLARDSSLSQLVVALERELEKNPSAPFIGEDCSNIFERLNAMTSENEYRLAVMPALAALLVSIGLAWWSWAFAFIPITALIYCSSLTKRDDIPQLALEWLLSGRGSLHALDEIRLWATQEAAKISKNR